MQLSASVLALSDYVTRQRRILHTIPEPGFSEHKTRTHVWNELEAMGVDRLDTFAQTGIRACIISQKPNARVLAFRADMDALSVTEETHLPFCSQSEGFMHACGHDGHMAILLGFARLLVENRKKLNCDVVLLFQPAEESIGGALPMIEEGALRDPDIDMIFGLHMMPEIPSGRIGLREGPAMASTCEFHIEIQGRSAHGAMPHRGIDSIVAAAHFITMLQTIPTRSIDPFERALVTIGRIEGGERGNIIAEKTLMKAMLRTFTNEVYELFMQRIRQMLEGLETSFGVKTLFRERAMYPPVINHADAVAKVMAVLDEGVHFSLEPLMIAEDFSRFQQRVPGAYYFLGCKKPGFEAPLHNNRFNFDEADLLNGIEIYKRLVM